jgi:ribosomal protein S18 acetylase RimI-like enzyme
MIVIPAATGRLQDKLIAGIRPFDIGTDLRPVAELIADAFAHELDPRGSAALREMRIMSHIGGVLKLLNRSTGEFDDLFGGFVWLEEGKVVGNVTVQRGERTGSRWQIANVAVAPAYRGRGIARQLVAHALDHIRENAGQWAVLQVYERNVVARTLYDHLGFEVVAGNTELRLSKTPNFAEAPEPPNFTAFSVNQWQPLYDLANNQLGTQAQWWRSLRRVDFQLTFEQQLLEWFWRTAGRSQVYRWAVQRYRHHFDAALLLTAMRWRGVHQLKLWVRPEQYGQHEEALLGWALARLQAYPRWPVQLSLPHDHAAGLTAAQRHGFQVQQTLLTMRRAVS